MSKGLTIETQYQQLLPKLQDCLGKLTLNLSEFQQYQLLYYLQQLLFWNKAYNLTAIKQAEPALIKHIVDSLSIVPHLPAGDLLDIGTGAGLPAVVIAICQPERVVTALDSNAKKIRFIKQMVGELGLKNLTPIVSRIEEHQATYQVITSRAFASLTDFANHSQEKLDKNGEIWAMKGIEPLEEMVQLQQDWHIRSIPLNVPMLDEARHLIVLTAK